MKWHKKCSLTDFHYTLLIFLFIVGGCLLTYIYFDFFPFRVITENPKVSTPKIYVIIYICIGKTVTSENINEDNQFYKLFCKLIEIRIIPL